MRNTVRVSGVLVTLSVALSAASASAQVQAQVQVQGGVGVQSGFVAPQPVFNQPVGQPVAQPVVIAQPVGQPVVMGPRPIGMPIAQPVAVPVTGPIGPQQAVNVQIGPPPPRGPDQFVAPRQPGQVWVRGYWAFVNGQQQWVPGHWEMPPQQGQVWIESEWNRRGRRWSHRPGYWGVPQQIAPQYLQPGAFGVQAQVRPYQVGQMVTGSLDTTDFHAPQGGYVDDYAVFLQAGQPVTFVVTGGPSGQQGTLLDVVASIHFQGQQLASDDDSAGFPHARLVFTPRMTGVYALRVASYGARFETGSYSVQSWQGAVQNAPVFNQWQEYTGPQPVQPQPVYPQPVQPQPVYVGPQPVQPQPVYPQPVYPQPVQPQPIANAMQALQLNTTIQGALQPGDQQSPRGGYADQYILTLQANQQVTLVARGIQAQDQNGRPLPPLDVTLDVLANGAVVAHDDDSAGNRNARLFFTATQPGTYVIQVSTWGSNAQAGAYNLTVVQGVNPSIR
jgi:hypothetical protein